MNAENLSKQQKKSQSVNDRIYFTLYNSESYVFLLQCTSLSVFISQIQTKRTNYYYYLDTFINKNVLFWLYVFLKRIQTNNRHGKKM